MDTKTQNVLKAIEEKYEKRINQFSFSQPLFNKKELTIKIHFSK